MSELIIHSPKRLPTDDVLAILKGLFRRGGYAAGGFCRWLVSESAAPAPYGDIDIWCDGQNGDVQAQFATLKAYLSGAVGEPIKETWAGCTFYNPETKTRWQLILPRDENQILTYGLPQDLLASFDFTITMAWYSPEISQVFADERLVRDDSEMRLRIVNVNCPVAQVQRIEKYARRGYRISVPEVFRVFAAWDDLPAETRAQWRDGLTPLMDGSTDPASFGEAYSDLLRSLRFID